MSLRYLALSGLLAFSLAAQTPANPPRTSDRTDDASPRTGHGSSSGSSSSSLSSSDRQFVMKAAQGGKMEVELGQLGVQNASSEAVKNFAQRLITDHTNANQELMQIASQKGVNVPEAMSSKDKDKFSKMQGAAFDRAYMQHMIKDHQKDIALFEKESNSGSDPDVKAFAAKTLPTLREHLEQARSVANNLGSASGSQSSLDPSGKKGKQP